MVQTKRWKLKNDSEYNQQGIKEAAELLKSGMAVAFPTETVYGLGADATNEQAVARIFEAKGRPADNPLIAHVATKQQLRQLVQELPPIAEKLIEAFSPGPLTYILPSNGVCAKNVTAGLSTIAVRIPDHPVANELLKQCDTPIAAPSANISGKPSPTTAEHVWADLQGKIAGLLDGGPTGIGVESTVIDCTQEIPIVLRPGSVTREQLERVAGRVMIDPGLATVKTNDELHPNACKDNVLNYQELSPNTRTDHGQPATGKNPETRLYPLHYSQLHRSPIRVSTSETPIAPGMKYKHYAPEVPLWLVDGTPDRVQEVIDSERKNSRRIGVMASEETAAKLKADYIVSLGSISKLQEIAANLYDALRSFKSEDADFIICETFSETGIGQAIMNRLKKAASVYMD